MVSLTEFIEKKERVNPFTNNLARLNLAFSFSASVFSFALFLFLQTYGIPIIYGGIGLSAGQLVALILLFPQGRAVDKGHSFTLMITGSVLYGTFLIILFLTVYNTIFIFILVPATIAGIIVVESTFRTSLNSFVSKSANKNILGSNFSRIIAAETIGSAASFAVLAFASYTSYLAFIVIGSGAVLLGFTGLVFFILDSRNREFIRNEEKKTPRPGLKQSVMALKNKFRFVSIIVSSKAFMNVGSIAFSFFYVPTGMYMGIPPVLTFSALLVCYVIGALIGRLGEQYIDNNQNFGKMFVAFVMLFDLIVFTTVLTSMYIASDILFLAAAIATIPSPLLISGAMAYETNVVGKQYRGTFSAIQRTVIGSSSVFVSVGLTALFAIRPILIWWAVSITSSISLIIAMLLRIRPKLIDDDSIF